MALLYKGKSHESLNDSLAHALRKNYDRQLNRPVPLPVVRPLVVPETSKSKVIKRQAS